MCYYFKRACDDMLHQFIQSAGDDAYFMICIHDENYLYCANETTAWKIRGLLFLENIILHIISTRAMLHIVSDPHTQSKQHFHGNKALYKDFAVAHGSQYK
ncbi:MAG: hypothetical protein QM726_21255 [Chitinophagaceae bacterium]